MLVKLIIRWSALSLGLSYVACTTAQQQSQLATLHERMNQMISALYSSPLLSKVQAATSSEELPSTSSSQEANYSYSPPAPVPQIVYVSPPGYLEAGVQPTDYGYPTTSNPVARSAWPFAFDYGSYQPQFASTVYTPPYPRSPYPEYARPVYPQVSASQPALPPASPFSSPLPYPSPYPTQLQYPNSAPLPIPICQPVFPVGPSVPGPYPPQVPFSPSSYPAQAPHVASLPYPPPVPTPYPPPGPPQYAPSMPYLPSIPIPYPSSVPVPYPPSIPVSYSPSISMPYSSSIPYPQPLYATPPSYFKPSDMLPQSQYDYTG